MFPDLNAMLTILLATLMLIIACVVITHFLLLPLRFHNVAVINSGYDGTDGTVINVNVAN